MPNINRLVDGAFEFQLLSFLDIYFGHNQIRMHPSNKEKNTFIAKDTNFYYRVIPFGLKNVRLHIKGSWTGSSNNR